MRKIRIAYLSLIAIGGMLISCNKVEGVPTPSKMIGPAGGTASFDGITLIIPEGALDASVEITASFPSAVSKTDRSMPMLAVGKPFELGPDGTQFNVPVTVTVDTKSMEAKGVSTLGVFCYSEEDDSWNLVGDAKVTAGLATFETTHFSLYAFSYLTMLDMYKFDEYAKSAVDSGRDDQSIIDRFLNYFVEDKYVMEAYRTFAPGRYYKPFNCLVKGAYIYNGRTSADLIAIYGEIRENFKGWHDTASGVTSQQLFKKTRDGKITEDLEMFYSLVDLEYEMVTPTMDASINAPLLHKGETATVTVKLYVTDEFNGDVYPCYDQEIKVGTSDEGQVDISETLVKTDSNGEARFTVTAMCEAPNATIRTTYSYKDEFDSAFAQKAVIISNKAEWIMHASITEWSLKYEEEFGGLEVGLAFDIDAQFDPETLIDENQKLAAGKYSISNVKVVTNKSGNIREEWDEPDSNGGTQHCIEEETFTMSDFVCNSCDEQDLYVIETLKSDKMVQLYPVKSFQLMSAVLNLHSYEKYGSDDPDEYDIPMRFIWDMSMSYICVPLVEGVYDIEFSPDPGIDYNRDGIFCSMLPPMMQESGMGPYSTKATYDFGEGYTLTLTGTVEMSQTVQEED